MACANAVGSNVFNIFLGIGLPMILSEITWKEPYVVPDGLPVHSPGRCQGRRRNLCPRTAPRA